ncbi:MAG: phosphonate C-P lyase system protein PhnH [Oryzomonas sp.]|uniref:phosphonate C-P lyase system protein PhnH n=1 Tax=Oryzomonas sp. TaxID=2855186 RepID=UPI002840F4E0|nr:phosphonate C-P lyase system protein PhnH [Oryzomonas sp.]MDR3581255.1 phosphonate C-P lyase system protein PhnH [Oryzomonas sp.]
MHRDTIINDHAFFRVLLRAMSRPGSVCRLPHQQDASGTHGGLTVMLRCLMDHEVTHYVADDEPGDLSREILRLTGSSRAAMDTADFLVFPTGTSRDALAKARRGTLEYPDKGATVVFLVERLGETGGKAQLHGPGIDGTARPLISGLAEAELRLLRDANAEFPLGLDALFLDAEGRIMCIPRSTRIGVN